MSKFTNPDVSSVFETYPDSIRDKMLFLRSLVFATAAESDDIDYIEESLKWGEPTYHAKSGKLKLGHLRMDWKVKNPEQLALYFNCQTKLVDTFKEIHGDIFDYGGNRSILFSTTQKLSIEALKNCIEISLSYHQRKHLPLLGA